MLTRRHLIQASLATVAAASLWADPPSPKQKYRVAVIGHTGRGNYGHGLDVVWLNVPNCELVAVADADEKGLAAAVKKLKAPKGYADYRKMLEAEKPDLITIAPRYLDEHRDMVLAAIDAGVRGIFCEKPLCRTLAEADQIVDACHKHGVKLVIAFQSRFCPRVEMVHKLIHDGRIGQVLEFRARGKEDKRGGGEDLWVLGAHVFNLIQYFGGAPEWCFGQVLQNGKPITKADVHDGAEGIGPLAGDEVHAVYRLSSGAMASFDSVKNGQAKEFRYGITIGGSTGCIFVPNGYMTNVQFLDSPTWRATPDAPWQPITSAGINQPEPLPKGGQLPGNVAAALDLISAIENGTPLRADVHEARASIEMTVAPFESHRQGKPVTFPLMNRENPLTLL